MQLAHKHVTRFVCLLGAYSNCVFYDNDTRRVQQKNCKMRAQAPLRVFFIIPPPESRFLICFCLRNFCISRGKKMFSLRALCGWRLKSAKSSTCTELNGSKNLWCSGLKIFFHVFDPIPFVTTRVVCCTSAAFFNYGSKVIWATNNAPKTK